MPHKDIKEHREYSLKYYHSHPKLKQMGNDNKRLNYWRREYMKKFNCDLSVCKTFTETKLKNLCRN